MKNWFGQLLTQVVGDWLFQLFSQNLKKKAIIAYLKLLNVMRKSLLAVILIVLTLQMMALGFIGTIVTGVWLLPIDSLNTKLCLLFAFFLSLFLLPLILLLIIFSERTWLKISGAEKLLDPN